MYTHICVVLSLSITFCLLASFQNSKSRTIKNNILSDIMTFERPTLSINLKR